MLHPETSAPAPGRPLYQILTEAIAAHESRLALLYRERQVAFGELDRLAHAYGAVLAGTGLRPGDRLGLMGKARPQFVVAALAALKLGAAIVLISPAWKRGEVEHALALCRPAAVAGDAEVLGLLGGVFSGPILALDEVQACDVSSASDGAGFAATVEPSTEAALVFSSGTTGLPKAVVHTHQTLGAAAGHWAGALGLTETDRFQIATPPSHILGLLNIFAAMASGSAVRLHERFDLDEMLRCIEADRLTLEMAVAPIALALAEHPSLESFDLSSLRYFMWCATPIVPAVAREVTERTGAPFTTAYGASEFPLISANRVQEPPETWRVDTAGRVIDDIEARVVDIEAGAVLPPGETGEIQVRGPAAMVSYLPESANTEAFCDGWYRTGDIGRVEPEGWVHITDRLKEMIKVKGFQVAPAEVEAVLLEHPGVSDCAVFGVPDSASGETVVAAVVRAPGATITEAELQELVVTRLAKYKRPAAVLFCPAVPRTPSGKVLRRVLRSEWAEAARQTGS